MKKDTRTLEQKRRDRELSDIRAVALKPEGRRFIWRLISKSGLFNKNGHTDIAELARMEGKREMGIDLLTDIMKAKPTLYAQMQDEFASEKKSEDMEHKKEITKKKENPLSYDE